MLAIAAQLGQLDHTAAEYATRFLDLLLPAAVHMQASDVHLHPLESAWEIRWRIDGVLQPLGTFPRGKVADVIVRLKVLAELLTYRTDIPQEGRIRQPGTVEMRVSTFPTLHGERAVIRLFAATHTYREPEELGLPPETLSSLRTAWAENHGAVIISGPAGAGKTTTAYACLRAIVRDTQHMRSILTLEDPIESVLPGVSQSQLQSTAGLTLATGLRSLLRQDPEVILVGEIRDRETAEGVFQAALTGHLVFSTFHAGSAAEGLGRLREMGIEPYLIRSGLQAMLNQRLLRRLCCCTQITADSENHLGLTVASSATIKIPQGCDRCAGSGYRGRLLVAELMSRREGTLGVDLERDVDTRNIHAAALAAGMVPMQQRGLAVVERGETSPSEYRRVFGFGESE